MSFSRYDHLDPYAARALLKIKLYAELIYVVAVSVEHILQNQFER
jgi:hypothetical protein